MTYFNFSDIHHDRDIFAVPHFCVHWPNKSQSSWVPRRNHLQPECFRRGYHPIQWRLHQHGNYWLLNLVEFTQVNVLCFKVLQAKGLKADLLPTESQDAISLIDDASEVLKASIIANTSLTSDNLKDIGFTLDTMFVSCYFDGVKCSVADFTWSYSYQWVTSIIIHIAIKFRF